MLNPFLKWVGGKRWLVDGGHFPVPVRYERYIEPFLGGGAVFFRLMPKQAILSDINTKLIETYNAVKTEPEAVRKALAVFAKQHSDEFYYKLRDEHFNSSFKRAAQFLYLNRTCFNGIYRENLKGEFNVPRGSKDTVLFENDNFAEWSNYLSRADLRNCDFEETIDNAVPGDFVFADPPYTVRHNKNGFIKYNQKMFSWADQQRLASSLRKAAQRGVFFVLTNADHESIRDLYSDFCNLDSVHRSSVVAARSSNRSATTELLVTPFSEVTTAILGSFKKHAEASIGKTRISD